VKRLKGGGQVNPEQEVIYFKQFEELGVPTVRLMLANGRFPPQSHGSVIKWLAARDTKEAARNAALLRSANLAAWIAALASILGLAMGLVTYFK
jgi:hypothetical protein